MEEVKRNEMERRARGAGGGGVQDCRVGHVCDVSGLTSWLYQQVVHIGSSGRAAKHPCHVSLRSCREQAASVDQDLPNPVYWMSDAQTY